MVGCSRLLPGLRQIAGTVVLVRYSSTSIRNVVQQLKVSQNVLVMAGAGLSTASGIPDFRSPGSGLYHKLQEYQLPYPEAIFDLGFFARNPRPFLKLAQELYPGIKYWPNKAHHFIKLLHHKGKLLRMYTQNIDGLERLSGIPEDKLVEAHGSFSTASCILCYTKHDPEKTRRLIMDGQVVHCDNKHCGGLVKPDIVFFGEAMPARFFLYELDADLADFLLIMGTSLEVYPFAGIADYVMNHVPRLLINREAVGSIGTRDRDTVITGDIVENVMKLAESLGWQQELHQLVQGKP